MEIPLLLRKAHVCQTSAIEVYPSATLKHRGIKYAPYKKPEQQSARIELVNRLATQDKVRLPQKVREELTKNHDLLDAVVCVLAGSDFLLNRCMGPEDCNAQDAIALANKEGWIWF
jgi:hypothetical protein